MTLEDQVRDALDDLALRVPPRAGLADAVLREARRRRAKVRLATAGSTVVAVAAGTAFVVADPLATDGGGLGIVDPAAGGDAPEQVQEPNAPAAVTIDLDELPTGRPPSAPWYVDGALYVGGEAIPFEGDFSGFRAMYEVADSGLAVLTVPTDDEGQAGDFELSLVSRDGGRILLGAGQIYDFAVSSDGTLLAWAEHDWTTSRNTGPGRTVLYVADATTGEVLHEREQIGDDGSIGIVKGFLDGGRVVLDSATNAPGGVHVWHLVADTVTSWTDYGFTSAISRAGDLAVLTSPNGSDELSSGVVDTATEEVLWTTGQNDFVARQALSWDSRYLVITVAPTRSKAEELEDLERAGEASTGTELANQVVVADARTGERVLTVEGINPRGVIWQPDGSLIFEAWEDENRVGLVRCALDGKCELAAPVREVDHHDVRPPYILSGNQ
ncbi:hypothetical protein E1262_17880 [Jiangella aurantiaca]|uniref:WD40 repeat domain-containing protein n=1 Tax=Jiangella aurantiaca TaxID=2530373 RepID=A0A4V2YRW1_9ACTN|nr:hypothetical protein [Jiangella aurantiaca]TDD67877.1 hypothetical protein E1262_17880 [Jiangella aurantiaca]